ncbi:MAG: glycoside hydrolase family 43 protein [Tannerellaceae bacterium]|jgi:hypothetical protein|nr:glycoside hydrolase family 43 protein [Tannerellaceae bacterium]
MNVLLKFFCPGLLFVLLMSACSCGNNKENYEVVEPDEYNLRISEMRIRDPFILADKQSGAYYMYANNRPNFKVYKSLDLVKWKDLGNCFTAGEDFWGTNDFWAPDVYAYKGKYYLFATFSSPTDKRGTSILVADKPEGPFSPLVNNALTPPEQMCLDGALYIDNDQKPWMIYCHEWLEAKDGEIIARQLSDDLRQTVGDPHILFTATEAPWVGSIRSGDTEGYVTDAPFIHKLEDGRLIMTWSSFRKDNGRYAIGMATSGSGNLFGPWKQEDSPLNNDDGGHAMLFRDFKDRLMISYHSPNSQTETPRIKEVYISNGKLVVPSL